MINLLSPKGVVSRKPYVFIIIFIFIIKFIIHKFYEKVIPTDIISIIIGLLLIIYLFTVIKRLKDCGWSRWFSILAFVPLFYFIFLLILAFTETKDENEIKEPFSWGNFRQQLLTISGCGFQIAYAIYGLVQYAAIYSGAYEIFHNNFGAFLLAIFTCYIPLVGTGLGIYGAHIGWKLSLPASFLLFLAPYLIFFIPYIIGTLYVFLTSKFQEYFSKKNGLERYKD